MPDIFDGVELSPEQQQMMAILKRAHTLFNSLYDHPEHGVVFKKALKAVDPTLQIPDIDVAEKYAGPLNEKLTALEEKNTKLETELQKDREERTNQAQLGDLSKKIGEAQKRYRLTDDGMKAAIDRMKETGNPDPFAAAAWVVSEIEPAKPVQTGSNFGPMDANVLDIKGSDDADRKLLHNDPDRWFNQTVDKMLTDFQNGDMADAA
jgi:hypothetical protein